MSTPRRFPQPLNLAVTVMLSIPLSMVATALSIHWSESSNLLQWGVLVVFAAIYATMLAFSGVPED